MKNQFVSLMTALLIGTSFTSFAKETSVYPPVAAATTPLHVETLDAKVVLLSQRMKMDVVVSAAAQGNVFIRLRNAQGQLLVVKRVAKSDGVSLTRFNLADLEDGTYQVEITDGSSKQVKEINLQTSVPVSAPSRTISLL